MFSYTFSNLSHYKLLSRVDAKKKPNNLIRALRVSLSRHKNQDIINQLNSLCEPRICNFCGETFITGIRFKFVEQTDGSYYIVNNGHARDKDYGKYHACSNKSCPSKKLNPNSVKFVSICYGMNEDSAYALIHSRNKSPFYACNHSNKESYNKHQSHSSVDKETKASWHKKKIETTKRNKLAFIAAYGEDEWRKLMKIQKDSSSLRHFIEISSSYEEAIERYNAKCLATARFKPNLDASIIDIERHFQSQYGSYNIHDVESFKAECIRRLDKLGPIGRTMFINKCEKALHDNARNLNKNITFILYGKILFKIDDLYKFLDVPKEIIGIASAFDSKMFSYQSFVDGFHFRSDLELKFYYELKKIPHITVLNTNKAYAHGILKKYDFKIKYNDEILFIELCSNIDQEYIDNVLNKRAVFSSVLISKRYIKKFIDDAINCADLKMENYYECC